MCSLITTQKSDLKGELIKLCITVNRCGVMNSITVVGHSRRLCSHGEDSVDFAGSKQSDDVQCQKPLEQFTSE